MNALYKERTIAMRKPAGFTPPVQRWSACFPEHIPHYRVAFYGVQSWEAEEIAQATFFKWFERASTGPNRPAASDHSRFVDQNGFINHVYACYWSDDARFQRWQSDRQYREFWDAPARTTDAVGCWREEMLVPIERQESVFFLDFIAGIGRCEAATLEKTFETGYFGSMRDRIPLAASDALTSPKGNALPEMIERDSAHARWQVHVPENLAVIRSGQYWGRCQQEQYDDYLQNLKPALDAGMEFLRQQPKDNGCCALRFMRYCDVDGREQPETAALGYFLSLAHLESWSENHPTHHSIYGQAMAALMKYQERREFRTWHEVFVLPNDRQFFEYCNCHPHTGLLGYFDAIRKA